MRASTGRRATARSASAAPTSNGSSPTSGTRKPSTPTPPSGRNGRKPTRMSNPRRVTGVDRIQWNNRAFGPGTKVPGWGACAQPSCGRDGPVSAPGIPINRACALRRPGPDDLRINGPVRTGATLPSRRSPPVSPSAGRSANGPLAGGFQPPAFHVPGRAAGHPRTHPIAVRTEIPMPLLISRMLDSSACGQPLPPPSVDPYVKPDPMPHDSPSGGRSANGPPTGPSVPGAGLWGVIACFG